MEKSLLAFFSIFCALFLIPASMQANEVTVPNDPLTPLTPTSYLPTALNSGTSTTSTGTFSVSQQLYFASELSTASSRTITAITFYCNDAYSSESPDYVRRKLRVWMNHTSITAFPDYETNPTPNFENPGTKVFSSKKGGTDNGVEVTDLAPYTLTFDTPFEWDGTSNILVTVFDSTGVKSGFKTTHHMIQTTGVPRFLHQRTAESSYANAGWSISNLTAATAVSQNDRGYVNKITFTFEAAAAVVPGTPDDLAVTATTATSATLSWSSVSGATSYDLQQSANGSDWSTLSSGETETSYSWTGLSASSTQYARIRATNSDGSSDWSDAVTVSTDALHEHNGISFDKWVSTTSLPTSGNYYINDNMNFDAYATDVITLTGNLNLCLNGKTVNMESSRIVVPSGKTLTIYDNVGGGKITSFVPSVVGAFEIDNTALIVVKSGGTLVLKEGVIENSYIPDEDGSSYAIYSNGILIMSGAPVINSNDADIYLAVDGVITLGGALSNLEKYSVKKYSGATLTSGWSTHMSGENPRNYFVSANSAKSVCLNEGEASLRTLLHLSESSLNSGISSHYNQVVDVDLTRSLTSSQYNTFCLPFALDDDQLKDIFGVGYDLEEFESASLDDDILSLTFNKVTALESGKPYLLWPSVDVVNPSFEGVTIAATSPVDQTSDTYISFHGTYAPTELAGGNKNLLFLGAGNELFWPEATGNIKGFRAYFEVKGSAAKAAKKARIVKKEDAVTGIETITNHQSPITNKILRDGQILIIRDGKTYNVLGIECK